MANYLIGDIQGCFAELQLLLAKANFDPTQDHLYLAGDLVARGPDSLAVLRFIKSLGEHAHTVLGNHDLHLLATAVGIKKIKEKDKTAPIFQAPDKDELLHWLRKQPLLIYKQPSFADDNGFVLTHAGISPVWDLATAQRCANEVEALLQSDDYIWLLENMYADEPKQWDNALLGLPRYRYIINAFTRMRFCEMDGSLDMKCKSAPDDVFPELTPWFKLENRKQISQTLVFGHWAALNGYINEQIVGLDTGCVWGNALTMMRWEDKQLFSQPSLEN